MPQLTTAQLLEQIDSAISDVLAGAQEVTIDGRTIQMPNLDRLMNWREEMLRRQVRENRATRGLRVSIGIGGPR